MPAGVAYPTRPALGCSGYQIFIVGAVPLGLFDSSKNIEQVGLSIDLPIVYVWPNESKQAKGN
jgi:hypothetical protein